VAKPGRLFVSHSTSVRPTVIAVAIVWVAALAGCDGGDASPAPSAAPGDPATTTVPRSTTPFCTEMLRLEQEAGSADDLARAYRALLPEVPPEILAEFEVLIARVDAALGEGEAPDPTVADESAFRVAAYVDRECRVTAQSPLPAPVESVVRE
jgi:hypothetical protein